MVKCKLYSNHFGDVSVIYIDGVECSYESMKKVVRIFKPQYLVTKVLALDRNEPFFKTISDERYKVFFPEIDTITSEAIIISKAKDIISVFEALIKSEPRCISFYDIKDFDTFQNEIWNCADEYLIKSGMGNYCVSLIVEESCIKITFNARHYHPKELVKMIKEQFC